MIKRRLIVLKTKSKMGRPKKDPARSKLIRYGKISDTFENIASQLSNELDRKLIFEALEFLKESQKQCS
jgi:hypothetical protein